MKPRSLLTRSQQLDIAFAIVTKRKAAPKINLFRVQSVTTTSRRKSSARIWENALSKSDDDCLFDAQYAQGLHLLIECLQQRWRRLRMQDGARMRLKRDYGRHRANCPRALDDGFHDELMAQMQAIKDAERQHGRAARCQRFRFREIIA